MLVMTLKSTLFEFSEVPKVTYFQMLRKGEVKDIEQLLPVLIDELNDLGIKNPYILAVGSSTFPQWYWEQLTKLKEEYPEENIPLTYNDINLRVLQDEKEPADLRWEVALGIPSRLNKHGYTSECRGGQDPENRLKLVKVSNIYHPVLGRIAKCEIPHISTYYDSVRITEPVQTDLEVIFNMGLGGASPYIDPRTNELVTNPIERIKLERGQGTSFSLLYPDYVEA